METAVKSIYGGEKFTITVKAVNHSSQTATETYFNLNLNDDNSSLLVISSAIPSQGKVEFYNEKRRVICRFGDIKGGETAIAKIELQIAEFGDVSQIDKELYAKLSTLSESARIAMSNFQRRLGKDDKSEEIYIRGSVGEAEFEENLENNTFRFHIKAFPSKNIPPRVEIISPKNEAVFNKPADKTLEVPIIVRVIDPDGKSEKVVLVIQPNVSYIWEDNQQKFIINGKKYTYQEMQGKVEQFLRFFEMKLKSESEDIYTVTLKDLSYGKNTFLIKATDDLGREGIAQLDITVKDDTIIETKVKIRRYYPN